MAPRVRGVFLVAALLVSWSLYTLKDLFQRQQRAEALVLQLTQPAVPLEAIHYSGDVAAVSTTPTVSGNVELDDGQDVAVQEALDALDAGIY
jgi:hypothetical protein